MRTFHSGGIAGAQGDITQGLPRVEELFDVRHPKKRAILSEIDGVVELRKDADGNRQICVFAPDGRDVRTYSAGQRQQVVVEQNASVVIGTPLTAGHPDLSEIPPFARARGRCALSRE